MKFVRSERPTAAERELSALRREGEQYLAAGMLDRLALVNEQLRLRGADEIDAPTVKRQTRQSTGAATRAKRG